VEEDIHISPAPLKMPTTTSISTREFSHEFSSNTKSACVPGKVAKSESWKPPAQVQPIALNQDAGLRSALQEKPPHGAALADRAATRPERRAWADGSTITRIMTATRTPPGLRAACSPRPPGRQRGPVCEQRKQYEDLRRMEQPGHSTIAVFRPTPSSAAISLLPRMRRVTTQAAFAESLMAAEGQSTEALCAVCEALRLIFASHSLAFCSAAKRAASTGIPSIRIIVESSCK